VSFKTVIELEGILVNDSVLLNVKNPSTTTSEIGKRYDAIAAINGSVFAMSTPMAITNGITMENGLYLTLDCALIPSGAVN